MVIRIYKDKRFELLDDVYDPGEDTFLLVEAALREARHTDRILEVGTGSGVVSLFMKDVAPGVVATDISPIACRNARLNGISVIRTDLYAGLCGRFDLVIFNPPYLPTAPDEKLDAWLDRAFNGGITGRKEIERFVRDIDRILAPDGRVLTVISSITGVGETEALFKEKGFRMEIVATEKVPFERLVVLKFSR
jgi:release factor glutamine methyltransferase